MSSNKNEKDWSEQRLENLLLYVGLFIRFLNIKRDNYFEDTSNIKITYNNIKFILKYILLNCDSTCQNLPLKKAPEDFDDLCTEKLSKLLINISDKYDQSKITFDSDALKLLYTYIDRLKQIYTKNKDIKNRLLMNISAPKTMSYYEDNLKNLKKYDNLTNKDDITNAIFQSILTLSVNLSDSIVEDAIIKQETLKTIYAIICGDINVFKENYDTKNDNDLDLFEKYKDNLKEYNYICEEDSKLVFLHIVQQLKIKYSNDKNKGRINFFAVSLEDYDDEQYFDTIRKDIESKNIYGKFSETLSSYNNGVNIKGIQTKNRELEDDEEKEEKEIKPKYIKEDKIKETQIIPLSSSTSAMSSTSSSSIASSTIDDMHDF